jgi:hypothetical protein
MHRFIVVPEKLSPRPSRPEKRARSDRSNKGPPDHEKTRARATEPPRSFQDTHRRTKKKKDIKPPRTNENNWIRFFFPLLKFGVMGFVCIALHCIALGHGDEDDDSMMLYVVKVSYSYVSPCGAIRTEKVRD